MSFYEVIIDNSTDTGTATQNWDFGLNYILGTSFQGNGKNIRRVSLSMKRNAAFNGNISLYLQEANLTTRLPIGSYLAGPANVTQLQVNTTMGWVDFTLSADFYLDPAKTYVWVLSRSTSLATTLDIERNSNGINDVNYNGRSFTSFNAGGSGVPLVGGTDSGSPIVSSINWKFRIYAYKIPQTVVYNVNAPAGQAGNVTGTVPQDSNQYFAGDTVYIAPNSGNLAIPHHTPLGWATTANASVPTYVFGPNDTVTPPSFIAPTVANPTTTTLYMIWQVTPTYTVTYNANAPIGPGLTGTVPVDNNLYEPGWAVPVAANTGNLARMGYRLLGWDTNPSATTATFAFSSNGTVVTPSSFTMGNANVTLYAVWQQLFTIGYNANFPSDATSTGGNVPTDANVYIAGESVTIQGNTGSLTAPPYQMLGWDTNPSATTPTFTLSGSGTTPPTMSMPANNVQLYAVWYHDTTPRTVTYNANFPSTATSTSGTVPTDSNTYYAGDPVTVLANTGNLQAVPFLYLGWAFSASAVTPDFAVSGSTVTPSTFTSPAANTTLYAVWQQLYTVTYAPNPPAGTTLTGSVPVDNNLYRSTDSVTVQANPNNLNTTGYKVIGWDLPGELNSPSFRIQTDGITVAPSSFIIGAANITLNAVWQESFGVTYAANPPSGTTYTGTVPVDPNEYFQFATVSVIGNTGNLAILEYGLDGWDFNPLASLSTFKVNIDNTVTPPSFAMGTAPVTLYAVWRPRITPPLTSTGKPRVNYWNGSAYVAPPFQFDWIEILDEMGEAGGNLSATIATVNTPAALAFVQSVQGQSFQLTYNDVIVFQGVLLSRDINSTRITCGLFDPVLNYLYKAVNTITRAFDQTPANLILQHIAAQALNISAGQCPTTPVSIAFNEENALTAVQKLAAVLGLDYWPANGQINIGYRSSTLYESPLWQSGSHTTKDESKVIGTVQVWGSGTDEEQTLIMGQYPAVKTGAVKVYQNPNAADIDTLNTMAKFLWTRLSNPSANGNSLNALLHQTYMMRAGQFIVVNRPDLDFISDTDGFQIKRITKTPSMVTVELDVAIPQQMRLLQDITGQMVGNGSTQVNGIQVRGGITFETLKNIPLEDLIGSMQGFGVLLFGLDAEKPAPDTVSQGAMFYATDTQAYYFAEPDPITGLNVWTLCGTLNLALMAGQIHAGQLSIYGVDANGRLDFSNGNIGNGYVTPFLKLDGNGLSGYNSSGQPSFYIDASNGNAYFANGSITMNRNGMFIMPPGGGGNEIVIDSGGIAGFDSAQVRQFYIDISTGKGTFGAGTMSIGANGLVSPFANIASNGISIFGQSLRFVDGSGNQQGTIGFDSSNTVINFTAAIGQNYTAPSYLWYFPGYNPLYYWTMNAGGVGANSGVLGAFTGNGITAFGNYGFASGYSTDTGNASVYASGQGTMWLKANGTSLSSGGLGDYDVLLNYNNGSSYGNIAITGSIVPKNDNSGTIGQNGNRFSLVRAVTITPGDLVFENDVRMTEIERDLAMYSDDGELLQYWGRVDKEKDTIQILTRRVEALEKLISKLANS